MGCSGEFKEISPGPKSRYWVNSIGEGALDRENTRAVYRSLGVRGRLSVCRNVLVLCSDKLDGSQRFGFLVLVILVGLLIVDWYWGMPLSSGVQVDCIAVCSLRCWSLDLLQVVPSICCVLSTWQICWVWMGLFPRSNTDSSW